MVEQREKKLKTYIGGEDLRQDDGDHGLKLGYVKRKGINDVSPILASLFSPTKRSMNLLGSESNRYLSNERGHGFASERALIGQGAGSRIAKHNFGTG